MNRAAILRAQCVSRSYPMGASRLEVLKGVDLEILAGDDLCIVGSSGAGKSTLLHILGTLDMPTLGKVFYRDQELTKMGPEELARFRNDKLGFVFQFHHLLSEFSALENVMMPLRIAGIPIAESRHQAMELLETLGLAQRWSHFPSELSGGEQQRVAIARALIRRPEILLADEPTGNLDTQNGEVIQKLFFELKEKLGLTLVVVTHDREFAKAFTTTRVLKDGTWLY